MRAAAVITASCLLLCAAAALYFALRPAPRLVKITSGGRTLYTLDLKKIQERQELEVFFEGRRNRITVSRNGVFIAAADCPDRLCLRQGLLQPGRPLVCLPNRLVVSYTEKEEKP